MASSWSKVSQPESLCSIWFMQSFEFQTANLQQDSHAAHDTIKPYFWISWPQLILWPLVRLGKWQKTPVMPSVGNHWFKAPYKAPGLQGAKTVPEFLYVASPSPVCLPVIYQVLIFCFPNICDTQLINFNPLPKVILVHPWSLLCLSADTLLLETSRIGRRQGDNQAANVVWIWVSLSLYAFSPQIVWPAFQAPLGLGFTFLISGACDAVLLLVNWYQRASVFPSTEINLP